MPQIRLFIPKDVNEDELKQTDRLLGYDFSVTCRGRSLRTILVKSLDSGPVKCTCKLNFLSRVATQSPAVAANIDGSTRTRQAIDHWQIACLQLQTALADCDVCQIIFYDRPCPGVCHYETPCAESSLSVALHLLNHQHSATQQRKAMFGWLQAYLAAEPEPHGQKVHTSMLCSEIRGLLCRIGTLCSHQKLCSTLASDVTIHLAGCCSAGHQGGNSICSDVASGNRLLLQWRQRLLAAALQHIAGICLAAILLVYHAKCRAKLGWVAAHIKTELLEEQITWLMGAPAGKLLQHAQLREGAQMYDKTVL